jgi:hypothetical protein
MKDQFDPYLYDSNMALKVTFTLWLVILWASHHTLLLILSAFSRSGYVFHQATEYAWHLPLVAGNIPALMLLLVALNRSPTSGSFVRWLWRHGIKWLLLSLTCGALFTIYYHKKTIAKPDHFQFWAVFIDFAIAAYLLLSSRIRAIFSDFPVPPETEKASGQPKNTPIEN